MDQGKVDSFAERLFSEINAAMSCLNMYLGHRLGLFKALAESKSSNVAELARGTGCNERYLREWLECMAVGGYVDYNSETELYSLCPEHATVLLDKNSASYAAAFVCFIPSFARVIDPLIEAFRSGDGIPYHSYGPDTLEAVALGNRPMFLNDYVARWIPELPDVESRLRNGGRVADIGCGIGWSSICLAQGFPTVTIDALDADKASINQAMQNAREEGVADRVSFHRASAETAPLKPPYDLVTAFECIHDMAYPVKALRRIRELATPGGAVLVADEAVGDGIDENRNSLGHMMYNFSVLHCLPQAMVFPEAAATGTVMGPLKLKTYAREAGFSGFDVLPIENPLWRFYRLTP
jgi:2-polyprenyl-3-methyl-5-hydroxy-6-metoxy-1,4-benzoquinol methylase